MAAAIPIFAGLAIAGTALNTYGQIEAGQMQAKVASQNADMSEANAHQVDLATTDKLDQMARHTSITLGKQRASYAKSGVTLEGSPLEILTETQTLADRDAYRVATEGTYAADSLRFTAAQERQKATYAKRSSFITAGSTLLSGLGSTALAAKGGQFGAMSQLLGRTS